MFTVFLSAHRDEYDGINNMARHALLSRAVTDLFQVHPVQVAGRYLGHNEMSIRVEVHTEGEVMSLAILAKQVFEQDCILSIDMHTMDAYLVEPETGWVPAGKAERTPADAMPTDYNGDFSYDGKYVWVAK
ncbi:hypothetical protein ABEQ48_12190 [Cutibacterium acnes]